jgi:hypothetical protein
LALIFTPMSAVRPPKGPVSGSSRAPGPSSLAAIVAGMEQDGVWPLTPRRRHPLEQGWVEMISRTPWQWFGTYTFREEVHPEKADKLFRLWCALLDERHLGKRWRKHPERRLMWVRGLEWQKRGVLHYHALIRNLPAYRDGFDARQLAADEWDRLAGFAYIVPVEEIGGVAGYISKYCSKGGEVDFSFNCTTQARLFDGRPG